MRALDSGVKARYKEKLELAGLASEKDPYGPVNFKDDMVPLEYGHIFGYFIRHPGVYFLITLTGEANIIIADWVILDKSE